MQRFCLTELSYAYGRCSAPGRGDDGDAQDRRRPDRRRCAASRTESTHSPQKITVETRVKASIADVRCVYSIPADIKQCNAACDDWHATTAKVVLRVDGEFSLSTEATDGSMGFYFAGTYTKIVKGKFIEYFLGDWTAQIEFVVESGAVSLPITFEPELRNSVQMPRGEWQADLNSLAATLRHTSEPQRRRESLTIKECQYVDA